MAEVTVFMPTFNEVDGVRVILPRIDRSWVSQIFVIDSGSTDGTVECARELGFDVIETKEQGIRMAYRAAMPYVTGDAIMFFSPDGNSIPEVIPELIKKYEEGYDLVIASRYKDGAKSQDDDFATAFGNWFFTKSTNILLGGNYTDVMVMFRIFRKELVEELELDQDRWHVKFEKIFRCRIGWENMMSYRAAIRKLKVADIPADEPPRVGGERKMRIIRWGCVLYLQLLRDFLFWR